MQTPDGKWRVEVGGVGATTWYTLIGPGVRRNLPSITALMAALDEVGVDMGALREIDSAA